MKNYDEIKVDETIIKLEETIIKVVKNSQNITFTDDSIDELSTLLSEQIEKILPTKEHYSKSIMTPDKENPNNIILSLYLM